MRALVVSQLTEHLACGFVAQRRVFSFRPAHDGLLPKHEVRSANPLNLSI
jgi:hypothetical protein